MHIVTYSEARDNLKAIMDRAANDCVPIAITRQRGEAAVLVSKSEWDSMMETFHLLSSPANAKRLMEGIERLNQGLGEEHELLEP
jgi:antitoxin YefM